MTAASFSPGGNFFAIGRSDAVIEIYKISEQPVLIKSSDLHSSKIECLEFSHDGSKFISSANNGLFAVWPVFEPFLPTILEDVPNAGENCTIQFARWSLDDSFIIGSCIKKGVDADQIVVWSSVTRKVVHVLDGHTSRIIAIRESPVIPTLFATASHDGSLRFWDIVSGSQIRKFVLEEFDGNIIPILDCQFSPDGYSLTFTDAAGRLTLITCDDVEGIKLPPAYQFYQHDNVPLVIAANGAIVDAQLNVEPHLLAQQVMQDIHGIPLAADLQANAPVSELVASKQRMIDWQREKIESLENSKLELKLIESHHRLNAEEKNATTVNSILAKLPLLKKPRKSAKKVQAPVVPTPNAAEQVFIPSESDPDDPSFDAVISDDADAVVESEADTDESSSDFIASSDDEEFSHLESPRKQRHGTNRPKRSRRRNRIISDSSDVDQDQGDAGDDDASNAITPRKRKSSSNHRRRQRPRQRSPRFDRDFEDSTESEDDRAINSSPVIKPSSRLPVRKVFRKSIAEHSQEEYLPTAGMLGTKPNYQLPYMPQPKDHVIYFFQGHQDYASAVIEKGTHGINLARLPYSQTSLNPVERCIVESVSYVVGPPALCAITIRLLDNDEHPGITFNFRFCDLGRSF